jgi:hypothetical protein
MELSVAGRILVVPADPGAVCLTPRQMMRPRCLHAARPNPDMSATSRPPKVLNYTQPGAEAKGFFGGVPSAARIARRSKKGLATFKRAGRGTRLDGTGSGPLLKLETSRLGSRYRTGRGV